MRFVADGWMIVAGVWRMNAGLDNTQVHITVGVTVNDLQDRQGYKDTVSAVISGFENCLVLRVVETRSSMSRGHAQAMQRRSRVGAKVRKLIPEGAVIA